MFLLKNYDRSEVINLGTGLETSIAELALMIKGITGFKGELVFDKSKPDGNPRRLLDNSKVTTLGWKASTSLEEGLGVTWQWYKKTGRAI